MFPNKFNKIVSTILVSTLVSANLIGCASQPEDISASYVSPLQYSDYNCNQVKMELLRVNRKVISVSGAQESQATQDAVAMGVGLVVFWPALFFLAAGEDQKGELARLKGEYEAIETVAIQKECAISEEIKLAQKQREEYKIKKLKMQESDNDSKDFP
jgi:hypothetical protein